ncbi:alanine dehydrogenase, partial [bacterium]|nr:alanine dehydrogenase [bacterium]
PTYTVDGITHYCVPNLPSLVARSATYALANATLPYIEAIVRNSLEGALAADPTLRRGVNIMKGRVTHPGLAAARGCGFTAVDDLLGGEGS